MARSINRVQLMGHLGFDPEVRTFQNGGKVANLRLATSRSWKDKHTGETREVTQWHQISILSDHFVRIAEQYLRKGDRVYIEGCLETRKWQDQAGQDRYATEVVIRPYGGDLISVSSRQSAGGGNESGSSASGQSSAPPPDLDDKIPF